MNLNFPTGVCIFCGQSPSESTTAQSPVSALATSVTQATTSPVSDRFIPIEWASFADEERKFPACVILPPTASSLAVAVESRATVALRQLNGMPAASQFSCPNALLSYGYNLFTKEPKEETNFLTTLKEAIHVPNGIHELIRSYVYSSFKHNTSIQEWCDYLKLDEKTRTDLTAILDRINERSKNDLQVKFIQNALEKIYIKITRMRDSLPEKSFAERMALEEALMKKMIDIIDHLINSQGNFMDKIGTTLCEIEKLADRNPENCFYEPFASMSLLGYAIGLMFGKEEANAPAIDINTIFAELGIETNPDFLLQLPCATTTEKFLEQYNPVVFLQTFNDSRWIRKALLEWAIEYYNLNQYEIVEGRREYTALTRALCQNPQDLETNEGIGGNGIQLTPQAILFLLEAAGIIRRIAEEKK